jgi:hypothetical protein
MENNDRTDFCIECGSRDIFEETSPFTHVVKGRPVHIERDHHMRCRACDAVTYPGEMLRAFLKSITDQIRREDATLAAGCDRAPR